MNMIRKLYGLMTFLASAPIFLLMLTRERGRARIFERFGKWGLELNDCIWFHGASMGEINGLLPVIKKMKEAQPTLPILVTATSVTGLEKAKEAANYVRLLPLDNPFWLQIALKKISPRAFVFSETEIWPALLDYLFGRKIPMLLVNARISDKSWPSYQKMQGLVAPSLKQLSAILVSSQQSADRFQALGAKPESIEVLGNAKYDVKPSISSAEEAYKLRQRFFSNGAPVLVLGSVRPEEEESWFGAVKKANAGSDGGVNLVLAPRHKEKFTYFEEALKRFAIDYVKWSQIRDSQSADVPGGRRVVFLDTMGELGAVYSIADVAFVGATLVNIGGHNPLEPAAYGACVVMGPYVQNVSDVLTAMKEKDACIQIQSGEEVEGIVGRMCRNDPTLKEIGGRGKAVWESYRGASDKILDRIMTKWRC